MTDVYRMPSLGSDMEAGTLIEWAKQPGDRLQKGDTIAVVETQKGAIEVEVFHEAVMGRPLIAVGDKVPVGTPMAELEPVGGRGTERRSAGREAAVEAEKDERATGSAAPQVAEQPEPPRTQPGPMPGRLIVSPAARRLAEERGVELTQLTGSGPDGAIILADVRAAAGRTAQPPLTSGHPAPRAGLDLAAMRRAIAAAMSRSKREIPHYYLAHDIDLSAATDWLARRNAELPPDRRLLMGVLFIKAVALTLRGFPELNGFDREGRFEPSAAIHVGSATAIRGGGLVAPAIHDADQLGLDELMARLRDLVQRVRTGGLRASELSDPTVTVTSLGERGVERLYGIIYPPQVAIVGFGTPAPRPWVVNGDIVARTVVTVTLAADHRHSDGHRGALFLAKLANRLMEPDTL